MIGGPGASHQNGIEPGWETDDRGELRRSRGRTTDRDAGAARRLFATPATICSHRVLLAAAISGAPVDLTEVRPVVGERGWELSEPANGAGTLDELLGRADSGDTPVPALVCAESNAVISDDWRWIAAELGGDRFAVKGAIPVASDAILETLDAALYNAGFATDQAVYERWATAVFAALEECDDRLARRSFWSGSDVELFDVFLFPTLYRFELVYHTHFKCNVRRLVDYSHLRAYLQRIYAVPGVAGTCRPDLIKAHYFAGQTGLNPSGVIPIGPDLSWLAGEPPGGDRDDPVKGAARRLDS